MRYWPLSIALFMSFSLAARGGSERADSATLEAVIVTAPLHEEKSRLVTPTTVLSDDALQLKMGRSIGETLGQELGIANQSFGPGVGTPVIRGQSGPRIRVLANGIGSNDAAQLSPDHAISVEPVLAERIEVLRGPATLLYGSGAIGGVVNVIDNRIPTHRMANLLGGLVDQRFDSVSNETTTAVKFEGGTGSLAYHLDGYYRARDDIHIGGRAIDEAAARITDPALPDSLTNSRGVLPNSSAHAMSGSAGTAWVGEQGFAGVSINRLEHNYGIAPDGASDATTRIDLKQDKYDFRGEWLAPAESLEALRVRLGYTDYRHTEVTDREAGAFFTNKSYEGRLELTHRPWGPWRGALGFQAVASDFEAFEKSSGETIVPASAIASFGVFGVESLELGPATYQLGLRIEDSSIAPRAGGEFSYTPVSASLGGRWRVNTEHALNFAITRSERAPQVQELLTNGFHDATRSFERGDPNLGTETSYNVDLGYRFASPAMRAEFDLFHNWAADYIFQQRTGALVTEEGVPCPTGAACSPVLQTRQADATFKGFEAKLVFPLMENRHGLIDLTLFSDYTRGQFDAGPDVPRLPPLRYGLQVDCERDGWLGSLRLVRADPQRNPGNNDTATPGYVLLNLNVQYRIAASEQTSLAVFAKGNNLLNENVRNATSYLRNFAPEPGRGAELGVRIAF